MAAAQILASTVRRHIAHQQRRLSSNGTTPGVSTQQMCRRNPSSSSNQSLCPFHAGKKVISTMEPATLWKWIRYQRRNPITPEPLWTHSQRSQKYLLRLNQNLQPPSKAPTFSISFYTRTILGILSGHSTSNGTVIAKQMDHKHNLPLYFRAPKFLHVNWAVSHRQF